jgi:uncharacterized protein (DUF58 family)
VTGRAFVLLLIAASTLYAARNVGVGWLYALGYALAASVVGSAAFGAWAVSRVRLTVAPGRKTEAGIPLPVAVTLENRGSLPRRYLSLVAGPLGARGKLWPWRRALVPDGWGSILIPELKPGERLTIQLPVPAPRRGVYALPAVYLQAAPLGLVACFRSWRGGSAGEAMVHPRVHALGNLAWLHRGHGHGEHESAVHPEDGGELTKAVRPYRSGDAMRQIHWKTTARTGQLAVRESEGDAPAQELAVMLDASAEHSAGSFEIAVEIAASLLTQAQKLGMVARLYSRGGEPGVQSLEGQLDWLATLETIKEPGSGNTPPSPPPSRGGNRVVVITARPAAWAGKVEACIHVGPESTLDDVLKALT